MNLAKEFVKLFLNDFKWFIQLKKLKECNTPKILLIGTPIHGNLGDHLIAEQEKKFLNDYFKDYTLFEIIMPLYHTCKQILKKIVYKYDIIVVSGGGWMGNLWIDNENVIRDIVNNYPDNKVVIFPQTAYYTDDKAGQNELKKTINLLRKHNNLTIFLRDKKSYELMKHQLIKVNYYPDMALYTNFLVKEESINKTKFSNDVLVCLRDDIEKVIDKQYVMKYLKDSKFNIKEFTTVKPYRIYLKNRVSELDKICEEIKKAQFIITDRLHAMILAVLNGVPCLAIDNKTGKVIGVYDWLKKNSMVVIINNEAEIEEGIKKLMNIKYKKFDNFILKRYFDDMAKNIRKDLNNE